MRHKDPFDSVFGGSAASSGVAPLARDSFSSSRRFLFTPITLLCALKAEYTKLSFLKAICDLSDPLDSRHGNALALWSTVRYYTLYY